MKGDNIFLFCESTGWIVDWTHPAVDFARTEQDQAPDKAKLQLQERGINAYHGLSQLLHPEDSSSEMAFLCDITVKM